jgi:hypothetical protein
LPSLPAFADGYVRYDPTIGTSSRPLASTQRYPRRKQFSEMPRKKQSLPMHPSRHAKRA